MINLGDFLKSDVFRFKFPSRNTTADLTTPSSMTLSVYKDDNTAETTNGVTLTTAFDSRAGLNHVVVDTSDAFYTTPGDYDIVVTAGTVGGKSVVGEVIAHFSLGRTAPIIRAALGVAAANLDTQLSVIDGNVDDIETLAGQIKSKTDALPAVPAAQGDIPTPSGLRAALGLAAADLDTQLDKLDTIDSKATDIKTKTDNLPANTATAITGIPLAVWNFDFLANIATVVNRYSPWNMCRHVLCRWFITGTTLTVRNENNSADAFQANLTVDVDGDITGSTPL